MKDTKLFLNEKFLKTKQETADTVKAMNQISLWHICKVTKFNQQKYVK